MSLFILAGAVALSSAPALADPVTLPGKAYVLRSEALDRDVTVRIADFAAKYDGAQADVAYLFVSPAEARLAEATLRHVSLNQASYGAVVVTVDIGDAVPADGDAEREQRSLYDSVDGEAADMQSFVVSELKPFIEARWPVAGETLVAGTGWGGQFALRLAAAAPGFADSFHIEEPSLPDGAAGKIVALAPGSEDRTSIDIIYSPGEVTDLAGMEAIVSHLGDADHYITVNYHEQVGEEIATGPIAAAQRVGDFIAGETLVPPY